MLRAALHAPEGKERVVEIKSPARRTVDRGGQDDARGNEGVSLGRPARSRSHARGVAERSRGPLSQAARSMVELRKVSAWIPSHDVWMGGQREEARDANQTSGE